MLKLTISRAFTMNDRGKIGRIFAKMLLGMEAILESN